VLKQFPSDRHRDNIAIRSDQWCREEGQELRENDPTNGRVLNLLMSHRREETGCYNDLAPCAFTPLRAAIRRADRTIERITGMRSQGSAAELEKRRRLAVRRVLQGHPAAEVARFLEVHERTVRGWVRLYETKGEQALAARPHPGPKPRLTAQQQAEVLSWFSQNPTDPAFGFPTELWTGARVSKLIRERWGVRLHPGHLVRWLRQRGITSQRVRPRPRGHNPQEMQRWATEQWPRILKEAATQAGRIVMIDETGMLMRPLVRKSLAPRGKPLVMRYQSKHRQKVSVQGALVLSPDAQAQAFRSRMHVDSYVDAQKTAEFLRGLLREWEEPLTVIWDRGNMHKGPHVRAVLQEYPRLKLEQFPPYCPDLNPVEGLWGWMKYSQLANYCPRDLRHLESDVARTLARTAENQTLLQSFTRGAGLTATAEPDRALAA
jgi:transposase